MAQQTLKFLQKLDTLPREVQFYCSSEVSELMLDEFLERNKIDGEILTNIFYEVFINDFDLDKIENVFKTYVNSKEDELVKAVNEFVGIVLLPIDKYFEKISFKGVKFNIPSPVEEYLTAFYGDDWREPRKYTDWRYNCKNLFEGWWL